MSDSKEASIIRKYKLLAEEYGRLRQDAAILKRAVLDERSRVADQDLALKLRDNELKLLAESNERLKFNNEKLTKRISVLQQALEDSSRASASNAGGGGQGWLSGFFPASQSNADASVMDSNAFNVLRDELSRKNAENAKLHVELASVKDESQQSIDLLNLKISKLKDSFEAQAENIRGELIAAEARASTAKESEVTLRQQLKASSLQLDEMRRELAKKEKEVEYILQEASSEDSLSRQIVSRQVLLDDSSELAFSALNAPSGEFGGDPSRQLLVSQASVGVQSVLSSFASVAHAEQNRFTDVKALSSGNPHIDLLSGKLIELYGEYPPLIDQLSKAIHRVKGAVGEADSLTWDSEAALLQDSLTKSIECHQKITTASQLYCIEELKPAGKSPKSKSIHDGLGSFHAVLERIAVSVGLLLEGSWSSSKRSRDQNLLVVIGHIRESFDAMFTLAQSLKKDFEEKFRSEETPTTSPKTKENHLRLVLAYEGVSRDAATTRQVLAEFANLLTSPPPLPTRGVALRPTEAKAAPLQKRSLKFLAMVNAQKPHFHVPYDEQVQHVQSIEMANKALAEANIESATLRAASSSLQSETTALKSSIKLLREELDSKNSLATKLSLDLTETKRKLDETTSLVTHLRSVNAKFTDQDQPLSPRGAAPSRVAPSSANVEKSGTKKAEPKKAEAKPPSKPTVPSLPLATEPPSSSVNSKPRSSSKSYNPFDSAKSGSAPNSEPSSYNPFAALEEKKPAASKSSSYNPFEVSPPLPSTKEPNAYNPFASPEPTKSVASPQPRAAPAAKAPDPVVKPRSTDFTVSVISQDGEQHDDLQIPPQDLEREQRLKALDLYNRQQKLEKLVKAAKEERDGLQRKLNAALEKSTSFERAERELKEQYEAQIQTLTEHIVKVSEMSARYKEELEQSRTRR